MKKLKYKVLVLFIVLLGLAMDSSAQCAMCKAQLETNDGEIGNGINIGIIFLMIIPYILLTGILLVFFRGRLISSIKRFLTN